MEETTDKLPRFTRSGSKFFDGSEGNDFTYNQPTPEQKKAGWAKKHAREQLIEDLAQALLKASAPEVAVATALQNAESGREDGLIKLLNLIKKPDKQEITGEVEFTQLVVRKLNENKDNGHSGDISPADNEKVSE
jgi:hypothetical protein